MENVAHAAESPTLPVVPPSLVERCIKIVVEAALCVLMVAEVAILFVGVVARYIFSSPFSWSDELASEIFLWLVMLGAVAAVHRGQHMRILSLFRFIPDGRKAMLQRLSKASVFVACCILTYYSFIFTLHEAPLATYSLEISRAWRISALPTGFALMAVLSALQLLRERATDHLVPLAILAGTAGLLWLASPVLLEIGNYNLIVFFVLLVGAGVLAGIPIAFVFLLATLLYLALMTRVPVTVVVGRLDEGMAHIILIAVPLFVFLGRLMEETGLARSIMSFLILLLGHLRGGLSYVLLAAMFIVSGISGSKIADMAAVAPVLFPDMKRRGSKPGELIALLSASGAMSETIPPSLVLITTGVVTGVSIEALFIAGLLPAALLALALCVVVWLKTRGEDLSKFIRPTRSMVWKAALVAIPGIGLPIIIRTAVVEGVATATEVSTIGILYTIVLGMILYRPFPWSKLGQMLVDTAVLSGAILLIVGAATAMAWALTQSGFSHVLATTITELPGGKPMFVAVTIIFFIILGSLLEGLPAIVIFGPLMFPAAVALGMHEVHYAIIVVLSMGIGLFIPPFGIGYWAASAIGQVDPDEGVRPLVPYMLALLAGLILIAAVPWISIGFL
ncbi:TRAP transporter large permease subunit [Aquibium sp. LZ166]|uniref:TRAP transporter large permease subunit n=1 Tax=Aquibium pacificus TaxID=3153579 RepID=A0ABV3SKH3_9HYPH